MRPSSSSAPGSRRSRLATVAACAAALAVLPGPGRGEPPPPFSSSRTPDAVPAPAPRVAASPAPSLPSPARTADEGYIDFSFDQVDVRAFVKLVGDLTGREFVVAEGVSGKITVVAPRISRRDVYPLFVSILESVGCSVVEGETVSRVVSLGQRPTPVAPVVGAGQPVPARGVITRIVRLEYVSAAEMKKAIESKVGGGKAGAVTAVEETNHLILTDTAESLRLVEQIIAEIDRPGLTRLTEVVPLRYASAEDVAQQLNLALSDAESRGELLKRRLPAGMAESGAPAARATVVAAPHSNSLLLVGTTSQIQEMKRILALMDVDPQAGRGRLNAVFLKYISAEDAAKSINGLLEKTNAKNAAPTTVAERDRRISIEASPVNNALLVDAAPADLDVVKKLVAQLDVAPDQVMIEVLIAEVSAEEGLEMGVEMSALSLPGPGSTTISGGSRLDAATDSLMTKIQQGIFPRGLTVGVGQGTVAGTVAATTAGAAAGTTAGAAAATTVAAVPAVLNLDAIRKSGKFKIVSETALEGQNNLEASVKIVNDIPILKSTIQGGAGTARDVVQNIERMDVGIKLKLTPHVIEGGEVRMTLSPSIEAVVDAGSAETQFTPTIARREVNTTVTVPDGQVIVIAGLTREDRRQTLKQVPLLGSIPLVGLLFRQRVDATQKTNMLIFVTPHIVTRMSAAEKAMKNWRAKTGITEGAAEGGGPKKRRFWRR